MRKSARNTQRNETFDEAVSPMIESLEPRKMFSASSQFSNFASSYVQSTQTLVAYNNPSNGDSGHGATNNAKPAPPPKYPSYCFGNTGTFTISYSR